MRQRVPGAPVIVNQWMPAAHSGDAIGNTALLYRDRLRAMGHDGDVFAIDIDDAMVGQVRPWRDPASRRGDVTMLHFATPSAMSAEIGSLRGYRVIQYHNITPAHFFAPYSPDIVRLCVRARDELRALVGKVDLAVAVSEYNRRELEAFGFGSTAILPLDVDVRRLRGVAPVRALARWLGDGLSNFLFVGRIAPNKRIEDIIRLAEHYKRYVDAYYRFIFVGRYDGVPGYYEMLRALIARLGWLPDRFVFTGPVPDAELATYYQASSAYISMSEHEGFCAPLVEAMATDVPVLAYSCTAVPETLGGAGVTFAPKDFEHAAELLGLLAFDDEVRARIVSGQRRRLADFSGDRIGAACRALVARFS